MLTSFGAIHFKMKETKLVYDMTMFNSNLMNNYFVILSFNRAVSIRETECENCNIKKEV